MVQRVLRTWLWVTSAVVFLGLAVWHPARIDAWLFFPLDLPGWKYEEAALASDVLAYGIGGMTASAVAVFFIVRRHWWGLAGIALLHAGWMLAWWAWKPIIARERPPWTDMDSFAYPSGHTTMALVLMGSLLLWRRDRWTLGTVALVGALTAWYRVSASVHWPSDVVGAAAWSAIVLLAVLRRPFTLPGQ